MGREIGGRDVERRLRAAESARRGPIDRRRHYDRGTDDDVRLGARTPGDPVSAVHAAAAATATLAHRSQRVRRGPVVRSGGRVRRGHRAAPDGGRPSGPTGVPRLVGPVRGGHVVGAVRRAGGRPATSVRARTRRVRLVGRVRAARGRRVHVRAAGVPVPAAVRAAHEHRRGRPPVRAAGVLRAHVHTDRPVDDARELQPDRVHGVHGHGGVHVAAAAQQRLGGVGPGRPLRDADRERVETRQQSGRVGDRIQRGRVHAEGQPVRGRAPPRADRRVRGRPARPVARGRVAAAAAQQGWPRAAQEAQRGRAAGRVRRAVGRPACQHRRVPVRTLRRRRFARVERPSRMSVLCSPMGSAILVRKNFQKYSSNVN